MKCYSIDAALLMLWPPAQYKKELQDSSLGTSPCVSTLCLPDVTAHDCKRSNTGGGNGLGTRLALFHVALLQSVNTVAIDTSS